MATRMRKGPLPYVVMGPRMVNPALGVRNERGDIEDDELLRVIQDLSITWLLFY